MFTHESSPNVFRITSVPSTSMNLRRGPLKDSSPRGVIPLELLNTSITVRDRVPSHTPRTSATRLHHSKKSSRRWTTTTASFVLYEVYSGHIARAASWRGSANLKFRSSKPLREASRLALSKKLSLPAPASPTRATTLFRLYDSSILIHQ